MAKTASGQTIRFLVDTENPTGYAQVLEERDDAGALTNVYSYGHDLLAQRPAGAQPSFYGYDALGSTRLLSNSDGAISDAYTYDAFGVQVARTGTTPNLHRYTGEQMDDTLGLQYLRARYLNTGAGRFATRDPFEGSLYLPDSRKAYGYAHHSPTDFVDPQGLTEYTLPNVMVTENISETARGKYEGTVIKYGMNTACKAIGVAKAVSDIKGVVEGVYMITANVNGGIVYYVGESSNIAGRLTDSHEFIDWVINKNKGEILEKMAWEVNTSAVKPGAGVTKTRVLRYFEQLLLEAGQESGGTSVLNKIKALGQKKFDLIKSSLNKLCPE